MQPFSRMLSYFVEVARQGSIRRASEHLNVSASAIDRQILMAEESLGVRLFNRLPGGMKLTSAGELMLRGAIDWRRDYEGIRKQIADLDGLRRGHVRISMIGALSNGFLPELIMSLRQDYPGITVETAVQSNDEVCRSLAAGEADLGFCLNPKSSHDIEIKAFREIPLGIASSPRHRLRNLSSVRFSDLVQCDVIRPLKPLEIAEILHRFESSFGITLPCVAVSNDIGMIRSLIRGGVGVSLMSEVDVYDDVAAGHIIFTPLIEPRAGSSRLALCRARHATCSKAADLVLQKLITRSGWLEPV